MANRSSTGWCRREFNRFIGLVLPVNSAHRRPRNTQRSLKRNCALLHVCSQPFRGLPCHAAIVSTRLRWRMYLSSLRHRPLSIVALPLAALIALIREPNP